MAMAENAFTDLIMNQERTDEAIRVIVDNAKKWAKLQVEAG